MALLPPIVARVNFRNAGEDRFVFRALINDADPKLTETANKAELRISIVISNITDGSRVTWEGEPTEVT